MIPWLDGLECGAMGVVVAPAAVASPAVSAAIADVNGGMNEIKVVATRVARIDGEVPIAIEPIERAIEISSGAERIPLPGEQNVAHVEVALHPAVTENVVHACDIHEVVKVYFVSCIILFGREVQLVGHLVGEEKSLPTRLLIAHGAGRQSHQEHGGKGCDSLFHNLSY